MAKDVTSAGDLIVGDQCRVDVSKGSKKVSYNATLLGVGKYTNSTVLYILVYKLCTLLGSKREMEYMLNTMEQSAESSEHDSDEDDQSLEIEVQIPTAERGLGRTTNNRKRPTVI